MGIWDNTKNTMEKRYYNISVEQRESTETESESAPVVVGHAAVFDTLSDNLGGFQERISPKAFDNVLDNDVRVDRDTCGYFVDPDNSAFVFFGWARQ